MTGKAYYITTLADWQRHAPRFANSHFIVLDNAPSAPPSAGCCSAGFQPANLSSVEARDFLALSEVEGSPAKNDPPQAPPLVEARDFLALSEVEGSPANNNAPQAPPLVEARDFSPANNDAPQAPSTLPQAVAEAPPERQTVLAPNAVTRILVLIEADEGVHLSLEDEPAFEPLPHPLAQKPISDSAQAALAPHRVAPGATTFDAAEALARIHPLLRHRVF